MERSIKFELESALEADELDAALIAAAEAACASLLMAQGADGRQIRSVEVLSPKPPA